MSNDIAFRDAGVEDCNDLFKWRNHTGIRKYFFNSDPVSWSEHKRWFDVKSKDSNTNIYIACCGEEKVGTVRFDDVDDSVKVSVMLNPDYLNKGLGSEIIGLAVEEYKNKIKMGKTIIAEIRNDNIASIKAFTKAGFGEHHRVLVYNI
jgi:UDP-2,4-diacetamido-2,4,6-trideoxy-beta-L-altropyranose hydrolase